MNNLMSFAVATLMMSVAMPTMVSAQTSETQTEIIVTAKYQKLWDKGVKLENKGLDNLMKAEKALNNASRDVLDGQSKRDTAQGKVANASSEFLQLTSNVPQFGNAKEAAKWADQVSNAADSWAKNDNRQNDGQSDLTKGMKQQSSAQSAVDRAQSDIDKGRAMKDEARQRSSMR